MLRNLLVVPITTALLAFSSATQAQIWQWSFTDMGVDYTLTFQSLSGNVGTYSLTLDTSGYDHHTDPSYLDSVDVKAWGGTNISFSLLSAPSGSAWGSTEGPISSGPASNTGCKGGESGFACVEAITKGVFDVDNGPYTFSFAVTADSFYSTSAGAHVGAGYADANGRGASYGITSVVAPIPEPEIYAMLLAGFGLISFMARRRRQNHLAAA
jgi:hypothetical protein